MTDRPILFSAEMVRAILDGRKTQTRRIATNLPPPPANAIYPNHERLHPAPYLDAYCSEKKTPQNPRGMSAMWCWWTPDNRMGREFRCRYGQPGDTLWVRETWGAAWPADEPVPLRQCEIEYRADLPPGCTDRPGEWPADEGNGPEVPKWRPSIHMPRWASRITLRITDIRVERLQDISEDDAKAEGVSPSWLDEDDNDTVRYRQPPTWRRGFARLWHEINGPGAWDANPWVWVISFERVKP
jgi:hypothetical protein